MFSCGEERSLGADVHRVATETAGKLFATGDGMGAETGLSVDFVMIVVVGCGAAVLVLGRPGVKGAVAWDRDVLDTGPRFLISKNWPRISITDSRRYCSVASGRLQAMEARSRYSGTPGGLVEGSLLRHLSDFPGYVRDRCWGRARLRLQIFGDL
jgi:hypothetical protein